jgi:hypothetical protein
MTNILIFVSVAVLCSGLLHFLLRVILSKFSHFYVCGPVHRKVYDLYLTVGIWFTPFYAAIDAMHLAGNIVKHVLQEIVLNEKMYSKQQMSTLMDIINGRLSSIEWMIAYLGRKAFSFSRWPSWPSTLFCFFLLPVERDKCLFCLFF